MSSCLKTSVMALSAGILAASVAFGAAGSAAAREIKLANLSPVNDPRHESLEAFAKAVAERTNGALTIKVYPNSTLGKDREVFEQLQGGLTEMALNGEIISNFFDKWSIIPLPYMWRDQAHLETFLHSDIARRWEQETVDKTGVYILGFLARNPRILTTKTKPVKSIDDIKGMKIRVPRIDVYMDTWNAFGVQPTPMSSSEFFLALKMGTVDGMENPIELMGTWKIYEASKYLSYTNHMQTRLFLTASKKFLDSLPADQREVIVEEAEKIQTGHLKKIEQLQDDMEKLLIEKGMVIEKNPDLSGFKEKAKAVREKYIDIIGRDDYDAIVKM